MKNSENIYWKWFKLILRYTQGLRNFFLKFGTNFEEVIFAVYSDSDFVGDTKTRKFTSGFFVTFGKTAIDWFSRRQLVTALPTAEAEYVASYETIKEIDIISN